MEFYDCQLVAGYYDNHVAARNYFGFSDRKVVNRFSRREVELNLVAVFMNEKSMKYEDRIKFSCT